MGIISGDQCLLFNEKCVAKTINLNKKKTLVFLLNLTTLFIACRDFFVINNDLLTSIYDYPL